MILRLLCMVPFVSATKESQQKPLNSSIYHIQKKTLRDTEHNLRRRRSQAFVRNIRVSLSDNDKR